MKIIIAGSRSIEDIKYVKEAVLLSNFTITEIVSGTAKGVDRLGELYASTRNIPIKRFPADWKRYGKQAGYLRNQSMAEYADGLIAVWDGQSKGTNHMINIMKGRNKPFYLYQIYAKN